MKSMSREAQNIGKKELTKEKIEAQLVVQTTSIQENVKSNLSPRRTKLRLMYSFGRKIVIQGNDIPLMVIDN